MAEPRSRVPLERDIYNGTLILKHDRTGYARGCGCDPCRLDNNAARRGQRAARSAATAVSRRRAAAQEKADRQDEPGGTVRKINVTGRLSEQEHAAFKKYLADIGDSEAGVIRDQILRLIGWEDIERRQARRRPNRSRRSQQAKPIEAEPAGGEDGDDLWERLGDDAEDAKEGQ